MKRQTILISVLGLGVCAALVPVFAHEGHDHGSPAAAPYDLDSPRRPSPQTIRTIDLQTAEVEFGPVEQILRLTGMVRIAPDKVQIVAAPIAGAVANVRVKIGDRVKRGDPIAELQSPDLARLIAEVRKAEIEQEQVLVEVAASNANIKQLEAQVAATDEQARLAEAEAARVQSGADAVGANVISQKRAAAIQARSQATTLGINLEQQKRTLITLDRMRIATARSVEAMRNVIGLIHGRSLTEGGAETAAADLESTSGAVVLHAHIDGIVTERTAVPGQGVEAGQSLVRLADDRSMIVEGELPESQIALLSGAAGEGKAVRIRRSASSDQLAAGTIRALSPTVDPIKRTAHLLIDAENSSAAGFPLRDGMFVSLAVVMRSAADAVVVPASAIVNDGPMHFVFVKDGETYVKRDITPGARDDRVVELVQDGIPTDKMVTPGDLVVIKGAYALTQLRPKTAAAADDHGHDHHDHDH